MTTDNRLKIYLDRWGLVPSGDPIVTHSSRLLPVMRRGEPAMLKIAAAPEEIWGAGLMAWWDGRGAAAVIERDGGIVLLERATGGRSLARMAKDGADDEASLVICSVVAELHAPRASLPPDLISLADWFRSLDAAPEGRTFARCAETARMLLADPRDVLPLHGDVHHGNILDFGQRGWLAIDPKRLSGERAFDYANLFCNPDHVIAAGPGRLARQATIVARAARLDRKRLLRWIIAWAGLSAVWSIEDGEHDRVQLALLIAEIAAQELDGR